MLFLFRSAPEVEKRIHSKLFRNFLEEPGYKRAGLHYCKSLLSYKQISRWHKKLKNGNDSIRFTSQFCEQSKGINVAERFPQSILLHYTAFITTLATLGTTWQQCGQAWAQLGITWWPLVKHILSSWVPHNNHLWPYRDPQGTRDI